MISSDGHLEVLPERWTVRMPARYREKAPRTVTLPDGGDAFVIEGQEPRPVNFVDLRAGRTNENWEPFGAKVEETAGVGPPEQRVREQDMDGLEAEVLFPNMVMGPAFWRQMEDDDAYRSAIRAYNEWLALDYCPASPDRLIGLGHIPWTNLRDAIAEMEHCAKLGLRGVQLGVFPNGKSYPLPEDDEFWRAALSLNMPVTVHVGFSRAGPRAADPIFIYDGADPEMLQKVPGRRLVDAVGSRGMAPAMGISQLILSGIFDRLPELQVFFAETRLGWVPFWMEEADYWYERHIHWSSRLLNFKPLELQPSDYVRRNIHFSVQHVERFAVESRHHMGVGHIMFATDFPTGPTRGHMLSGSWMAFPGMKPSRSLLATSSASSTWKKRIWRRRSWRKRRQSSIRPFDGRVPFGFPKLGQMAHAGGFRRLKVVCRQPCVRADLTRPKGNGMFVVQEVYPDGHAGIEADHLAYVRDMANRVGFSVLDPQPGLGLLVHRIKLHTAMDNPYFTALLAERRPASPFGAAPL